jgi:hypothetical protein
MKKLFLSIFCLVTLVLPSSAEIYYYEDLNAADLVYIQRAHSEDTLSCLSMILEFTGTDVFIQYDSNELPLGTVVVYEGETDSNWACMQNNDFTVRLSSFDADGEFIICENVLSDCEI